MYVTYAVTVGVGLTFRTEVTDQTFVVEECVMSPNAVCAGGYARTDAELILQLTEESRRELTLLKPYHG